MTVLVWDQVGDRTFESGIDRGVLYLPDGSAVSWNGLVAVVEKFNNEKSPVYYEGFKVNHSVSLSDFEATLRALTYPEEFLEIEGIATGFNTEGVYLGSQKPKSFALCYRSRVGNDVDGGEAGYKLHVVYNLTASPSDKEYATVADSLEPIEFEWDISAIPEDLMSFGFAPSAHVIIDTRTIDPDILADLEAVLYGTEDDDASLLSLPDLLEIVYGAESYLIQITDNGDNSWTADVSDDSLLTITGDSFELDEANVVWLDADTYRVTDTIVRG